MDAYRIVSPVSNNRAEVSPTNGEIRIRLYSGADELATERPYFEGNLSRMLVGSIGRPWRADPLTAADTRIEPQGDALRIRVEADPWSVGLELSFDAEGLLRIGASWTNRTDRTLHDAAVGIEWELGTRDKEIVTIPHMIYNNNPSADPARIVPRLGVGEGKGFLCEEHRLPIPCVNSEWREKDGCRRYLSFYSLPDYVESPDGTVCYGSMGAYRRDGRTTIAAMSGVLMFNGEKDVVYVTKNKTAPYDGGYTDFPPGFVLSKTYVLDWGTLAEPGRAFVQVVRRAVGLYRPQGASPHTVDEIVRLKSAAMDDRWREAGAAAGYVKFNDTNDFGLVSKKHGLHYMYGWTGQCLKLAWCDAVLGFEEREPERVARCRKAADFYVRESGTGVPGLRHCAYYLEDGRWDDFRWLEEPVVSSRAYGETIGDLADIVMLFRGRGERVPASWEEALREAADFFADRLLPSGIYPPGWRLDGTPADETITAAGIPCAIALLKTFRATGRERYLAVARACMDRYYELHARTFERPFARSTLDARCEDKEAGMYFFLAAYELFRLTGGSDYKDWAELAADWLLTYVYMWSPAWDRGSAFREAGFNAVGWPGVSVQNHHLDVFFPTYELWRFGLETGNELYIRLARTIFGALGQGICTKPGEWGFTVVGEQAEGFFQSNFQGRGRSNTWNPSWVISEVLHHALRFRQEANPAFTAG